ncbi:MAG: hypothetical protein AB1427_11570 [Thermodesulfobacteriota bacterium]
MESQAGNKVMALILILLASGMVMAGCGKKAPPRPPGGEAAPAAVGNLSKSISGDTLSLTWNAAADRAADPAGFYVYRSKMRMTDSLCPACPVLFERVAVVPFVKQGPMAAPFEYRETLEAGYRYIYKVAAYSQGGLTGRESHTVEVDR